MIISCGVVLDSLRSLIQSALNQDPRVIEFVKNRGGFQIAVHWEASTAETGNRIYKISAFGDKYEVIFSAADLDRLDKDSILVLAEDIANTWIDLVFDSSLDETMEEIEDENEKIVKQETDLARQRLEEAKKKLEKNIPPKFDPHFYDLSNFKWETKVDPKPRDHSLDSFNAMMRAVKELSQEAAAKRMQEIRQSKAVFTSRGLVNDTQRADMFILLEIVSERLGRGLVEHEYHDAFLFHTFSWSIPELVGIKATIKISVREFDFQKQNSIKHLASFITTNLGDAMRQIVIKESTK